MDGRTDGYLWMGPSIEHLTVLITSKMMEYQLWYEDPNIPALPEVD